MLTAMDYMGGNNMGFICFSRTENCISWFAVSKQYRGKGTGNRLLKTALRQLDTNKDISVNTFVAGYASDERRGGSFHYRYPDFIKAAQKENCPACNNEPMPDGHIDIKKEWDEYKDKRYRPVSELSAYEVEILSEFTEHPPATAKEASRRIEEKTGLKRSPTQVRQFMHKIGLKPLKTAQIPAKADPESQREFLKQKLEDRIEKAKENKQVLLFVDAVHFVWQVYLSILWCISRIFIPAASGRERINVLGALDPITKELTKITNRTYITSATVCELLQALAIKYKNQVVTVVLDNARYQRCNLVIETAALLEIELLFLPTYSPNLNLTERLWRYVKKECLYSKYYKTPNEFERAIEDCLAQINTTKKGDLESLLTLKFQLYDLPSKSVVEVKAA